MPLRSARLLAAEAGHLRHLHQLHHDLDRNEQINDALASGNPTRMANALHAGLQQNADTFRTPESPCEPGQEAAMGDAYAKCVG